VRPRLHSPLYILGANPGGDPVPQAHDTIIANMDGVVLEHPDNRSAYRNVSWRGGPPGTHGMQPQMLHLFGRLGLNPGTIPASNLVFLPSSSVQHLPDYHRWAEHCWPFHESVIQRLGVRVVVCLGFACGNFVRRKLGVTTPVGSFIERNGRGWASHLHGDNGRYVAQLTHPGGARWLNPAADPTGLVEAALAQ
jgi:hypothetical protein